MITTYISITRDSNSWHLVVAKERGHFKTEDYVIDSVTIDKEFDVALGSLEPVIEMYGPQNITSLEELAMHVSMYPDHKPDN